MRRGVKDVSLRNLPPMPPNKADRDIRSFVKGDSFLIERRLVETEKSSIKDCAPGVKSPLDYFPISNGPRNVPFLLTLSLMFRLSAPIKLAWSAWAASEQSGNSLTGPLPCN